MANTVIQLKHSTIQGNVPVSLANGEISINTRDGKIFYADPTGTIQEFSEFSGPSGLNQEIQFNDSGVLGANSRLTFNKSTSVLTVVGGAIQGANLIYANTFIANTGGYFEFADGSKQYTANSGSSAANSFGRIYTSNNTTFANATVSTDQITFTGVDGVSVTANASTKTITFAGTPGAQGLTVDYGLVTESVVYSLDYGTL